MFSIPSIMGNTGSYDPLPHLLEAGQAQALLYGVWASHPEPNPGLQKRRGQALSLLSCPCAPVHAASVYIDLPSTKLPRASPWCSLTTPIVGFLNLDVRPDVSVTHHLLGLGPTFLHVSKNS